MRARAANRPEAACRARSTRPGGWYGGTAARRTGAHWETAHTAPDQAPFILEWARIWQAADKIVYSTTLHEVPGERTRIERTFDPETVRKLKAEADLDIAVAGPHLAAQAIRAGLVDEYHLFAGPAIVGGGNAFFPDGVRVDLTLLDERRFSNGVVYLRYGVKDTA